MPTVIDIIARCDRLFNERMHMLTQGRHMRMVDIARAIDAQSGEVSRWCTHPDMTGEEDKQSPRQVLVGKYLAMCHLFPPEPAALLQALVFAGPGHPHQPSVVQLYDLAQTALAAADPRRFDPGDGMLLRQALAGAVRILNELAARAPLPGQDGPRVSPSRTGRGKNARNGAGG